MLPHPSASRAPCATEIAASGVLQVTAVLCYRHMYMQQPAVASWAPGWADPTPYVMYKDIRLAIMQFTAVLPYGTAVGCSSSVTIWGKGFMGLGADTPLTSSACNFVGLGLAAATILNDTHITCATPPPTTANARYPLKVALRADHTVPQTPLHSVRRAPPRSRPHCARG